MTSLASQALYPLKFEPIYKEKVWGGRSLTKLGRSLPGGEGVRIGESWELADLGRTSPSGGGGGAERSKVANGPLAGRTLHELMQARGRAVMGDLQPNAFDEFPLLVKFLDARQNLSVQVHPSAEYAAKHSEAFLKSEAWYIVDAKPGAVIYKGIQEGVTADEFRAAIEADAVEPLLVQVAVEPGQCHYLPSGTCHALGAGVVAAEVQTPSDTTFRVYDWGRTDRELHVEEALACMHFGPAQTAGYEKDTVVEGKEATTHHLVETEYFRVDQVDVVKGHAREVAFGEPMIWMVLCGAGVLRCEGVEDVRVGPAETVLLPPGMRGGEAVFDAPTTWLEVTFPQAGAGRLA